MKEFSEIRNEVREMNISEESDLAFKAACVILYALNNDTWNMRRIHYATGFTHTDVQVICANLRSNGILSDDNVFSMENPDGEGAWMEFILICLAAAGDIKRFNPEEISDKREEMLPEVTFLGLNKELDKVSKIEKLAKKINRKLIFWEEDVRPLPPLEEEMLPEVTFLGLNKELDKVSKIEKLAKKINRKLIFWEEDVRPLPPLEEEIEIPDRTKEKQEPYIFYIPKLDYQ